VKVIITWGVPVLGQFLHMISLMGVQLTGLVYIALL